MGMINIFHGSDSDFINATAHLKDKKTFRDLFHLIDKASAPSTIEFFETIYLKNFVLNTDDFAGAKDWVLLSFCSYILENTLFEIEDIWINNPPSYIYNDLMARYKNKITETWTQYKNIDIKALKALSKNYKTSVIGQDDIIHQMLPSIYALENPSRKRPATFLFLGASGVGKTETAKYISSFFDNKMLRIQFSMQQNYKAYKYIFGGEMGETSLARELIKRESNIVLLDEFDKVNDTFYNAFYQLFDEGRFVDNNYDVNMEKTIIICTTNFMSNQEAQVMLGTPIYSRFSKVIKFNPISETDKKKIAQKIYKEIFNQLDEEDKKLLFSDKILKNFTEQISKSNYVNMRMLKNDIEETIYKEILKAKKVIN